MEFDWTISVGNILSLVSILGGLGWFVVKSGNRLLIIEQELKEIHKDLNGMPMSVYRSEGMVKELDKRIDIVSMRLDNFMNRMIGKTVKDEA